MSNSMHEHDIKCSPEKSGCTQLMLDIQSEFNDSELDTIPKDEVGYLKKIGNDRILQNHAQWEKGCSSDVESANDCNSTCDATVLN